MSQMPWVTITPDAPLDPDTPITVMASRLQLRSHRHIGRFMSAAMQIRRQLAASDGLLGYSLETQMTRKTFWTVSAWTDAEHLRAFTRAQPHHTSAKALRPRIAHSAFVSWTTRAADLPIPWDEAHRRIAAFADSPDVTTEVTVRAPEP